MKSLICLLFSMFIMINPVNAFSNSLDGTNQGNSLNKNNISNPVFKNNITPNSANTPFNPKEHTGFEHQDRQFPNPTMNDTRYNSNCQFGTCTPGGLNPNNK